jgi:hypothetical protein
MNNLNRAYLLANLFPDELKGLTEFRKKGSRPLYRKNRAQVTHSGRKISMPIYGSGL